MKKTELVELYLTIATEKLPSFPIIALSEVSESQTAAGAGHLMYFPASHGTCRLQRVSARLLKSNSASLGYPSIPEDLLVCLPEVANNPIVQGANSPSPINFTRVFALMLSNATRSVGVISRVV